MATDRLNIIIRLKNAAQAGLNSVERNLKGIGVGAAAASTSLKGMYAQMAAIAALFAGGSLMGSAIKTFKEFDDTMRQAGAVANATTEEMAKMTEQAKLLGKTTRFSASEAAEGMKLLYMAGLSVEEGMAALPGVLDLAAAGSIDLGQAADIATNVLAGFGLEVNNLDRVNDVLVKTFTSSNTTLVELGEAFKMVGPIAKGVGADFEDLFAAVGKLGDAGIKATMSGTSLRGALAALFNPTREEAVLMKQLGERIGGTGLQIKDSKGDFVGFAAVVEQLEKAGMRGEEALKLFGQRAGPGMAALVEVGSKSLKELSGDLKDAGGVGRKVAGDMEAGIGGAMREMDAAAESVKIALGEAFNDELINAIRGTRDILLSLTEKIKELDQDGTLKIWAEALIWGMDKLIVTVQVLAAQLRELARVYVIVGLVAVRDFEAAKLAIDDIGMNYKELAEKRKWFQEDIRKEVKAINETIIAINRQIEAKKKSIEQDREDLAGWRAKLLGAKVYQKQLEQHVGELFDLQKQVKQLNNKKAKLKLEIDKSSFYEGIDELVEDLEVAAKDDGPIGKGVKDVKNKINEIMEMKVVGLDTTYKANLVKVTAALAEEEAIIEDKYASNLIKLDQYYDERQAIIEKRLQAELKYLKDKLEIEDDADKGEMLRAQIYAKEKELKVKLLELHKDRVEAIKEIEEKRLDAAISLNEARLKAEKAYQDQKDRISKQAAYGLEAQFLDEEARLQDRQNKELEIIRDFHNQKMRMLLQQKADEQQIEKASVAAIAAIQQQQRMQEEEKNRLAIDQQQRLIDFKLSAWKQIAGGMSSIFEDMYELMGEKARSWFYLAKAAAIAEATINIAQGITKALGASGFLGIAQGALIATQGAIQIAKISAQTLASGGIVKGSSPHSKADDKLIAATSGEFMQPVDAVKHYGVNVMEAIRRKAVPRELFESIGSMRIRRPTYAFAEGGQIGSTTTGYSINVPVTINGSANNKLAGRLQAEVEQTVVRVMREEMR